MLYILLAILLLIGGSAMVILNLPSFGKLPTGERLERIKRSPNYRNGEFQNLEATIQLTSERSFLANLYQFLFTEIPEARPKQKIPVVQTDLSAVADGSLVWLGHSSYFLRIGGKSILIDPVFHAASPFSFLIPPFDATYHYTAEDIPAIDLLIITHDHWDHLDYKTVTAIKNRVGKVLAPLGVGSHLEYWGYDPARLVELDWQESVNLIDMHFTCLPTRHFSGRGLKGKQTLWGAFMLQTATQTIYIGGDGGYGKHIRQIAKQFPKIDLALMENGQYNEDWRYIHNLPDKLYMAMQEMGAKRYFTGHNSKFNLARHAWYAPLENILAIREKDRTLDIITPRIGEVVDLSDTTHHFDKWW